MRIAYALLAGVAAFGAISVAQAADLIVSEPVYPGVVETSGNWDGPYIGVFGGYAWGFADQTNSGFDPPDFEGADNDLSGWLLGLRAGANFYLSDAIVAGVVGDIAWSDVSGSGEFGTAPLVGTSTNTIDWQGSVRGILGFDGGTFLPYLTAGFAFADATHYSEFAEATGVAEVDATHVGWTVGAGVSVAATDNLAINLEYRYSDFGSQPYDHDTPVDPPEFTLTQHAVTVGLNWSF